MTSAAVLAKFAYGEVNLAQIVGPETFQDVEVITTSIPNDALKATLKLMSSIYQVGSNAGPSQPISDDAQSAVLPSCPSTRKSSIRAPGRRTRNLIMLSQNPRPSLLSQPQELAHRHHQMTVK